MLHAQIVRREGSVLQLIDNDVIFVRAGLLAILVYIYGHLVSEISFDAFSSFLQNTSR
jgi:hypothetical protein